MDDLPELVQTLIGRLESSISGGGYATVEENPSGGRTTWQDDMEELQQDSQARIQDLQRQYNEARDRADPDAMEMANRQANILRGQGDIVTAGDEIGAVRQIREYSRYDLSRLSQMYFDAVANVDPTRAEIAHRAANVQREGRNYVSASAADGLALVYKVYELLSYSDQALADLYAEPSFTGSSGQCNAAPPRELPIPSAPRRAIKA